MINVTNVRNENRSGEQPLWDERKIEMNCQFCLSILEVVLSSILKVSWSLSTSINSDVLSLIELSRNQSDSLRAILSTKSWMIDPRYFVRLFAFPSENCPKIIVKAFCSINNRFSWHLRLCYMIWCRDERVGRRSFRFFVREKNERKVLFFRVKSKCRSVLSHRSIDNELIEKS